MNDGKNRVVIEQVRPRVDHGRYPVKRTEGEQVIVKANIIADGHDKIRAFILYKKKTGRKWLNSELTLSQNDEWSGSFTVNDKGEYKYTVHAWVDHFDTWYYGFKKKFEAGQYVELELREGLELLEELKSNYKGKQDQERLDAVKSRIDPFDKYNQSVEYVLSEEFDQLLKDYPLKKNITELGEEITIKVETSRAAFSTWYELFPRSASDEPDIHGTFDDVVKRLPRIAAMGFDVLYLPPIHPIGKLHRKGKNNNVKAEKGEPGSPWAIGSKEGGHKDIHPQLGTLKDFQKLIKEAKKLGIDIAMDIAFQCAPDHPYVKEHPEWFRWRPDGTVQYAENPPKKYQDILPINFETEDWKALWEELKSIFEYWIAQGITIFRVDNPHTKPLKFWEWCIGEINSKHQDVIFLAEAFTRPKIMANLAKAGYQQSYTYFTWRVTKHDLLEYMNELVNTESRDYFRPNFWPNTPDILPYHLQYAGENYFIIRYILAATLSSNYGMYGPSYEYYDNIPSGVREEYDNSEKYEIKHHHWNRVTRLKDIITIVNKARKDNKALQSTWNYEVCEIHNDALMAYFKMTPDRSNMILCIVNLDSDHQQAGYVRLPFEKMGITNMDHVRIKLFDMVSEDTYYWWQEWNFVQIDPNRLPFHLFKIEIEE